MTDRRHSPDRVAHGSQDSMNGSTMRKVVVLLDEKTFEEVATGARRQGCSFAAQARVLIAAGLETMKTPA
jgi:hypothetical protein